MISFDADRFFIRLFLLWCFSCGIFTLSSSLLTKEKIKHDLYDLLLIIVVVLITICSAFLLLLF